MLRVATSFNCVMSVKHPARCGHVVIRDARLTRHIRLCVRGQEILLRLEVMLERDCAAYDGLYAGVGDWDVDRTAQQQGIGQANLHTG